MVPRTHAAPGGGPGGGQPPTAGNGSGGAGPSGRKLGAIVAAGAIAAVVLGAAIALANRDDGGNTASPPTSPAVNTPGGGEQTEPEPTASEPEPSPSEPEVPADEQCTEEIQSNERWVCLTSATFDGNEIVIEYQAEFAGIAPDRHAGFHLHIYGGDGTNPPAEIMGSQAGGNAGDWYIEDENPSVRAADSQDFLEAIGSDLPPKVCARIADSNHALVPDGNGGFNTGNCVPIRLL